MWIQKLIASVLRRRQFRAIDKATPDDIRVRKIEPELLLLANYLDPRKAFFDVGANVGVYVYVASKSLPSAQIFAFEPQPTCVARLRLLFPSVHIEQVALSTEAGETQLSVPLIGGVPYSGRGTLESIAEPGQDGSETYTVRTETLDVMKETLGVAHVGCIKIDVEGHEQAVLAGAEKTIQDDHPTIIIEIEQRHHHQPIETIFAWFRERDYEGSFYDNEALSMRPLAEFDKQILQKEDALKTPHYINNFVFTYHG